MSTLAPAQTAPDRERWLVIGALAVVYVVWGSAYLAIKFTLESFPPFLMAGLRFLLAGLVLMGWAKARGVPWPTWRQFRNGALVGTLLLAIGNGCVVFAEQSVASNLAALLIATVPVWATLFSGFFGAWPARRQWLGIGVGLGGVLVLNLEGDLRGSPASAALLLIAAMSWAFGTVWSRRLELPSGLAASAVQMVGGGVVLLVSSALVGEPIPEGATPRALAAFFYLLLIGSLLTFSAYVYLVRRTTPTVATSYAYVNPLVAVLLGATWGNERVGPHVVPALALIVGGVVLVLWRPAPRA